MAQERHGWHRLQPAVIGMSGLWAPTGWTCRDQDGAPRRFGPRGCLTWWCELPHDVSSGGADLSRLLVPDGLSELGVPLLPSFNSRPQGGGTALLDEQAGFTAMVYVPTSGGAWPPLLEPSGRSPRDGAPQGPRRRCGAQCTGRSWTNSAPRLSSTGRTRSSTPPWCGRKRTFADRPNPVGRGKQGSGLHRPAELQGILLSVAMTGANMHESLAPKPPVRGIPAIRSRHGPVGDAWSNSERTRRTSPPNTWPGPSG